MLCDTVVQRDGTSVRTWYSYRGVDAEGDPMAAASSENENQSISKFSGLWFLWLLVLVVAVVASLVLVKVYVVDRKNPPPRIAPTAEAEGDAVVAQSSTAAPATSAASVATSSPRKNASFKYQQMLSTVEETPAETKSSGKELSVGKQEEVDDVGSMGSVYELPLVVNVLGALGNLRARSPNSSSEDSIKL